MAISQRYLTIANGHMAVTGNSLLLYSDNVANGGAFITTDVTQQVPGYPAGTTTDWQLNSSMAVLTVPPGATVLYAELTWTSLLVAGAIDYSAFKDDPVQFTTPASATPVPVAVQFNDLTNDIYTRSADVTQLVKAGGTGEYTAGRIAGVNGIESTGITGNGAGWYLSVVFENPTEPSRLFQINVGNAFVPGANTLDFSITGFATPAAGPVTGRLFAGIQRGDPDVDRISIFVGEDAGSLNYQLTRPPLPDNNMIAGFISNTETGALIDTSGTFGNNNNLPGDPPVPQPFARWHIDIATFDISPSLTNNQTTLLTRSISEAMVSVFDYNVYNVQIDAQAAIIETTKSVDKAYASIGETLTYTIIATNTGTIMADTVVISDALPTGVSFVPGSVMVNGVSQPGADITTGVSVGSVPPNNGSVMVTFEALVNELPVPNPFVNTAVSNFTFMPLPGNPPINSTSTSNEVVSQVNDPDVSIVKTSTPVAVDVNGVITYSLEVTNNGNTDANNLIISDVIPEGTVFVPGSVVGATGVPPTLTLVDPLTPGSSTIVSFQVQVGDTLPATNPLLNDASVAYTFTIDPNVPDGGSGDVTSNTTSTPVNTAIVQTTKAVDQQFAQQGDVLTYTLTLSNSGNTAANNVTINDVLPAGTTFLPGTLIGASGTPPLLTLDAPLNAGDSAVVSFQVLVQDGVINPNPLLNTADVAFTYTVDPANPDGANGTSTSNTVSTTINSAIVTNVKTVDKAYASTGEVLTYTLTLSNSGNVSANEVVITDPIPTGTTYVENSLVGASGTFPNLTLANPIPAGGSAVITYQVLVKNSVPNPNPIENTATVTYQYTVDPALPNGESETIVSNTVQTQINVAKLVVSKAADKAIAYLNDVITYSISISNTGNVDANQVNLVDVLPQGVAYVNGSLTVSVPYAGSLANLQLVNAIAPGESVQISFQGRVVSMPNPNPIVNSVDVAYVYTIDPADPDGASSIVISNQVKTVVFRNNYEQEITDLIESVANQQAALAAIANAEGAKIQEMVAMGNVTQQQLLCLNKSVADMLDSIALLESILKQKLSVVNCQINGTC